MKPVTLTKNWEFQRAYNRGKHYVSDVLVTYVIKNKSDNLQIGITTSKKIGKAVSRNRCRRIIKAAFCNIYNDIYNKNNCKNYDLVFVARTKTVFVKSTDIEKCMRIHLQKAGII